jgi:hypothetical protein
MVSVNLASDHILHNANVKQMSNDNNGRACDCQLFAELDALAADSAVRPVDSPALQLN